VAGLDRRAHLTGVERERPALEVRVGLPLVQRHAAAVARRRGDRVLLRQQSEVLPDLDLLQDLPNRLSGRLPGLARLWVGPGDQDVAHVGVHAGAAAGVALLEELENLLVRDDDLRAHDRADRLHPRDLQP
jgi:hypothetical protein